MNQRTPKLFVVMLVLAGAILAGCQRAKGPDLQAEVDQLNAQIAELQSQLAATKKSAEPSTEEIGKAAADAEAGKRAMVEKDQALSQKDEQIKKLQNELGDLKRGDALAFVQVSALQQRGESATAFERYEKFIMDFPDSPLTADARRALADLKPAVEKDAKWKADLIDPRREERELLKRFSDGIVTTQELAPLLRRRTSAEIITLLGRPGRTFRNGTEYGYVDKVIDIATGNKETLVIRFEAGRVEGLRAGYQGRELKL